MKWLAKLVQNLLGLHCHQYLDITWEAPVMYGARWRSAYRCRDCGDMRLIRHGLGYRRFAASPWHDVFEPEEI